MFVEELAIVFVKQSSNLTFLVRLLTDVNLVTNHVAERVALLICVIARHAPTRPYLLLAGVRRLIIRLFDHWEETGTLPRGFARSTMRKLSLVVCMCCNCDLTRQQDQAP